MFENAKDKLIARLIIIVMVIAVFLITGFFTFFPFSSASNSESEGSEVFPMALTGIAALTVFAAYFVINFIVFPSIEKDETTTDSQKAIAKLVLRLAIFENPVIIGMIAIFIARTSLAALPPWIYINYIYIPIFLVVAYKCWPKQQVATADTFGGDLIDNQLRQDNV